MKEKMPTKFHINIGTPKKQDWKEHSNEEFWRYVSKELGVKSKEGEPILKAILAEKSVDDLLVEDMDAATRKTVRTAWKELEALMEDHFGHIKDMKDEEERAKKEAEVHTASLQLASARGFALANQGVAENFVVGLQKLMGDKFQVDVLGLTITEGATITEEDVIQGISCLARTSENVADISAAVGWNLGDLLVFAYKEFDETAADKLVGEAVAVTGRSKHTVMESLRLARAFPPKKRIAGLSMTHHQELNNYLAKHPDIDQKEVKKIIDDVLDGEQISKIKQPDGSFLEQKKVKSCAHLRKALQALTGKAPETPAAPGTTTTTTAAATTGTGTVVSVDESVSNKGFLYIRNEDGKVFQHKDLLKKVNGSGKFLVIDLTSKCVLDENGGEEYTIEQLDPSNLNKGLEQEEEQEEEEQEAAPANIVKMEEPASTAAAKKTAKKAAKSKGVPE